MKAIFTKLLSVFFIIMFFGHFSNVYAQTDSSRVTYSSENSDSSDFNYHRKYEYLDINLKDETSMFKIAVPAFNLSHTNDQIQSYTSEQLSLYFTYEKKITPSWAFLIDNVNNGGNTFVAQINSNDFVYTNSLNWGIRYYFLMKDRIKKGINGNNCNGVYTDFFLVSLNKFQFTHQVWGYEDGVNFNVHKLVSNFYDFSALFNSAPTFDLNIGLQKRLNNFSFIDAKFYFEYTPEQNIYSKGPSSSNTIITISEKSLNHFNFGLSFKIGFGWGWK